MIPFGLNAAEFAALAPVNVGPDEPPRVCFLGTFDGRKGGADLPKIFARVARSVPGCQFRLLGTAGLHQGVDAVRAFFPSWLRDRLEIVPRFQRSELATRLTGCAAGVFPSYFEGFPFGVLEMLAAGLPVVAYRSPGLPMTLTDDLLVAPGDVNAMADRLVALLGDAPNAGAGLGLGAGPGAGIRVGGRGADHRRVLPGAPRGIAPIEGQQIAVSASQT